MPPRVLSRVAAGLAACFVGLTVFVAVADGGPGDGRVLSLLSSGDRLDAAAQAVDLSTEYLPVGGLTAAVAAALWHVGRRREAVLAALSVAGSVAGTAVVKRVVERPRPALASPSLDVSELSFPSGHATATAALALAVVLAAAGGRWLRPALLGASALVVVAAAAQLLLALHHPSDIVAGWLWAGAWTTGVWAVGARSAAR